MSEVFRCDYCGTHASTDNAAIFWVPDYTTDNGDTVFTTGIYCSTYCAEQSGTRVGGR